MRTRDENRATITHKVMYFVAHPGGGWGVGSREHLGEKIYGTSVWMCIHFGGK